SGHYEAVVFSEGLQQFRDLLEPGAAVLLSLSAELQGDEVRARIQLVEPLDQAAAKLQKALRVFLRNEAPIESVAKRLDAQGDGEVSMVLMLAPAPRSKSSCPADSRFRPRSLAPSRRSRVWLRYRRFRHAGLC